MIPEKPDSHGAAIKNPRTAKAPRRAGIPGIPVREFPAIFVIPVRERGTAEEKTIGVRNPAVQIPGKDRAAGVKNTRAGRKNRRAVTKTGITQARHESGS
jgi:hypothetical protein